MTHTAYLIDMRAVQMLEHEPVRFTRIEAGVTPRERAEDAYAEALDDLEERWLGTRTHVARLEWERTTRRWRFRTEMLMGPMIARPNAAAIITGVA